MNIELPLYRQEKDNTCTLACLRMVLAAFGTQVEESVLESHARMEDNGVMIEEVQRLARQWRLMAEIQETSIADLRRLLREGKLPITFIDRKVFDLSPSQRARHSIHDAIIHTVIPTQITAGTVKFHDPRPPAQIMRKPLRLFERAHQGLGGYSVVCSKPASSQ